MTVVITILADDNARNRRRARRALQRKQAMQDDSLARKVAHKLSGDVSVRVAKAMSVGMPRDAKDEDSCCLPEISLYRAGYRKSESVTAR
ncbi:Uncharacterised protein [Cedecea lapagei]|uniref:Uncharacterized protein n=1 Tax=Cedecea lapagei TaxID=158823 RepID=A0A3S4K1F5_9ENTR|nr:hypothetical protein [Cedecea lapagei]VEC00034.1 Uncharacterised protein [Cedecea lapagei]